MCIIAFHTVYFFFCILDVPLGAVQLATSAAARLVSGFRPATLRQYTIMWKDFVAFQVAAGLLTYQVTPLILLAYLEFLATCQLSESNISNNIAALRALHVIHGLPILPFKDERIPLFIKSLKLTKPFAPKLTSVLNTDLLLTIVKTCEAFEHPIVYKALYLFTYFSFLGCLTYCPILLQFMTIRDIFPGVMLFFLKNVFSRLPYCCHYRTPAHLSWF